MDVLIDSLKLAGGIILLNLGANYLVKAAARVAKGLGVRPLLIGMTIVAFGTSAPEFVVSLLAAAKNQIGISYGNIIGSNIANIGLILGISALIRPLRFTKNILDWEYWFLVSITVLLVIFSFDGTFSIQNGLLFCLLAIGFMAFTIYSGLKGGKHVVDFTAEIPPDPPNYLRDIPLIAVGMLGLYGGSELVVNAGVGLMRAFGVSETVIGLTFVAIGTSLPELAASIVSVTKGETEICVGNVIGSNIFNTIFILGGISLLGDIHFHNDLPLIRFQLAVMAFLTILLYPFFKSENKMDSREGGVLLAAYVVFLSIIFWWPAK